MKKNVKTLVTFGETKNQLAEVAKKANIDTVIVKETVSDATQAGFKNSQEGDIILLSPACASWINIITLKNVAMIS